MAGIKKYLDKTCVESAYERVRECFNRFDKVAVSFSGGKDSTVVLNIAYDIAKEYNRLPLEVIFFDEEAIHPTTIDYVKRVAANKDFDFKWYCIPVKHRNACSRTQPWWYCWNPEEKDKWIRDLPENAITHLKGFKKGMNVPEAYRLIHKDYAGTIVSLLGIRADESLRRLRVVTQRNVENWITMRGKNEGYRAFPIYDFVTEDVWNITALKKWDYNKTYDVFKMAGVPPSSQRVCPPYGEEPLRGIQVYAKCFPAMWHKMLNRVHGVASAWRYSNTDLYSVGLKDPPNGLSWKRYLSLIMDLYPDDDQIAIKKQVNYLIKYHHSRSKKPIHDSETDLITGCSWKFLCQVVIKGDFKGRTSNNMADKADKIRERKGMSLSKAQKLFGR